MESQAPKFLKKKKAFFLYARFKPSFFSFHFAMKLSFQLFLVNEITPDKTKHLSSLNTHVERR